MNNTRNDILSKNTLKVNINITPSNNFVTNEAFKTLRSNLLFCGKNVKTIVVTSAVENEGKTTVSTELARGLAEISKKTLLIYGDMRKPATIKNRNVAGLAELLSGQAELAEVVYETQIPLLSVIFGGNIPPNPVELLSSEAFTDLLFQIKNEYDYIII
ncbi:MAG: CpsD/CapB family tyrosine-protein kinase, partial [Acutalibacteraceae bacterium]